MDQEIENLRFDTSDNNNDYNVHQCQVGDGDSNCAYGLNPLRYSKNDHSYYYGVPVGNYGRVGCVVISGGQGITCTGPLSFCCRVAKTPYVTQLVTIIKNIDKGRRYKNGEHIACVPDKDCV